MTVLIIIIVLAIAFDLINGFHDAANSIATVVSTKVLSPFQAVLWAAFFNFVAFWIFDLKVADTVAKTVHSDAINLTVIFAGMVAAIFWNLLTWWYGIPSSSSHTLIGGFAGAAIAHAGTFAVVNQESIIKTFLFIFLAPIIGLVVSYLLTVLILNIVRNSPHAKTERWFKRLQLVSSAAFSIGHGGSDSQKVMGIIAAALMVFNAAMIKVDSNYKTESWNTLGFAYEDEITKDKVTLPEGATYAVYKKEYQKQTGHKLKEKIKHIPDWVPLVCYAAIGLGTMMGGWRIVKTMGTKITKVTPLEGVAAETAGAITLYGVSQGMGVPVSTTHTITGAIIGVGVTKRVSAVRWGVTVNLLWAWILTIPVSGAVGAGVYYLLDMFI
ncbi:MAG: inorganic phosphate transporter [Bacteroidetes bacterium]|nr:inorganic phosphate transporter [Bacteroidota bacterium]